MDSTLDLLIRNSEPEGWQLGLRVFLSSSDDAGEPAHGCWFWAPLGTASTQSIKGLVRNSGLLVKISWNLQRHQAQALSLKSWLGKVAGSGEHLSGL